jgi:hypothetical protein
MGTEAPPREGSAGCVRSPLSTRSSASTTSLHAAFASTHVSTGAPPTRLLEPLRMLPERVEVRLVLAAMDKKNCAPRHRTHPTRALPRLEIANTVQSVVGTPSRKKSPSSCRGSTASGSPARASRTPPVAGLEGRDHRGRPRSGLAARMPIKKIDLAALDAVSGRVTPPEPDLADPRGIFRMHRDDNLDALRKQNCVRRGLYLARFDRRRLTMNLRSRLRLG